MKKLFNSINNFLVKINKTGYLLIILGYLGLLLLIVFILSPQKEFVIIPEYEHQMYNEDINAQITLVGIRSYNDSGDETVRYSVSAKLSGRLNSENVDPKLEIISFQMSAYLTTNKMYYFTEQTNRTTPISHTYTMFSSESEKNIPETFFVKIRYKDQDGVEKVATFQEEVMLELTNKEKYSNSNTLKHIDEETKTEVNDVELKFIATPNEDDEGGYHVSTWIDVNDLSQKYHIDMQTWVVTKTGRAVPFMAVYGYSDQKNTYMLSNREVRSELEPKEIYAKLVYYIENSNGDMERREILYKEEIANLPTAFSDAPTIPVEETPTEETPWVYWGLGAFALIAVAMGVVYIFVKKKKKINS